MSHNRKLLVQAVLVSLTFWSAVGVMAYVWNQIGWSL